MHEIQERKEYLLRDVCGERQTKEKLINVANASIRKRIKRNLGRETATKEPGRPREGAGVM